MNTDNKKRFATVCSGIGAPEVAWQRLGWVPVFSSEIEPFPNAVRENHFAGVPNFGDMTKFAEWPERCRCKPIVVIENPWVWVVEFKRVEREAEPK